MIMSRWCQWCGDPLGPLQKDFCNQKCADDYAADVWRELRQRTSASCDAGGVTSVTCGSSRTSPAGSPGSAGLFWTEEETETLRIILDGDVSASQAAIALSEEFHRPVTKNAVIGKCDRLGIKLPRARRHWRPAEPTPNPFPDTSGCLFGLGDPAKPGFRFCGANRAPGKPYCAEHAARAYDHVAAVEVA